MTELLILSKSIDASSTRYRALQYFELLRAAGYHPQHRELGGGIAHYAAALAAARRADLVLVLRKTLPSPLLWLLRRAARRLVFDLDDAIFCNTDGSPSATRMSRFAAMATASNHILAGNTFLAEVSRRFNAQVSVLPTAVDVSRYTPVADKVAGYFDVVWIGSSATRKYLEEALPALRRAAQHIPGLRLKIIADFDLPDCGVTTLPVRWQAATEAVELASARVGLAPMHDDDWSRGKCALKVLQYMAAGLPVLSSPSGVNAEAVVDGETGLLVRTEDEWVSALRTLADDPVRAQALGEAGRARVEAHYSLPRVAESLLAGLAAAGR